MNKYSDPNDPRGLIFEAYRINPITEEACRSIFFDWALGLPDDQNMLQAAHALHARFVPDHPDHPMTKLLHDTKKTPARTRPRRRNT